LTRRSGAPLQIAFCSPGKDRDQWHAAFARALPEADIHRWPDVPPEVDFALVWKPPAAFFEGVRIRRAIFNLAAGVDAVLALPSLPRDVPVVRIEDAGMAVQMAEYATYAVLRAYREFDRYADAQREGRWVDRPRIDKSGFFVGILGLGTLGLAVVRALRALDFPICGWSATRKDVEGVESFAGPDGLGPFLARSRVLVCLLPSTPRTRGLLDRAALRALPQGAYVVNVSRGDVLVDADLVALLDQGHLSGAMLDVFHEEPLPRAHPFWHHPKVMVTPHNSAVTLVDASVAQIAGKVRSLSRGEAVTGIVDPGRGY